MKSGLPEDVFCLCFLTLQWDLISSSKFTETISLTNLWWEDDHIKVKIYRHNILQAMNQKKREKVWQFTKYCFLSHNQSFTHTGVMLLVNFIHNKQWFKANTYENNLLFNSSYWSFVQIFPDRVNHMAATCPWDSKFETPVYTGIPLHCSILNNLIEVHDL